MLLDSHTTRDGHSMLIIEMDQDHLINMLNVLLRQGEAVLALGEVDNDSLDPWVQRHLEKLGYR